MGAPEWGPWIEHRGDGCPVVGRVVEVVFRYGGREGPFIAGKGGGPDHLRGHPLTDNWVHLPKPTDVMQYRLRRPRGMEVLDRILAEVDATPPKVPA